MIALPPVSVRYQRWSDERHLPRVVERSLQDRLAAFASFASKDSEWVAWQGTSSRWLSIDVYVRETPGAGNLEVSEDLWSLTTWVSAHDYSDLEPGPAATLRLAQTLESVLASIAQRVVPELPTSLGRTRRELAWLLEGGNTNPGPGPARGVRLPTVPASMDEEQFWSLIEATGDDTGAVRSLDEDVAAQFRSRLRTTMATIDTSAHRQGAADVFGHVSDDVWDDVRAWLITRGRPIYDAAVRDPSVFQSALASLESEDQLSIGEELLNSDGR